MPAHTFIASAMAVLHQNAIPVFVDTDPQTFLIDTNKIEQKITARTKAIMVVQLSGFRPTWTASARSPNDTT